LCLLARKRRLLLLTLGRFARLARSEVASRRSDRALPVGAARCKRLRVGQARPAMGEKIRLACRFGLGIEHRRVRTRPASQNLGRLTDDGSDLAVRHRAEA
jgi:hypothetical protein